MLTSGGRRPKRAEMLTSRRPKGGVVLDLKYIRENAKAVEENSRNRGVETNVGLVVELADRRSELIQESNELKQRQNEMARSIGRERDEDARARLIEESRAMKERLPSKERELHEVEDRLRDEQSKIPNMTHPDSPIGKDDTENVEIRRWGEIPEFHFEPKDHVELGEHLGIIDFDAGAKTTGTKFYFLRGDAVLLELGLIRYAMDIIMERGYQPTITPDLARDQMLVGTGFIPRGPETQIYSVEGTDLSMVATAEIPLAGQHADEMVGIEERIFQGLGLPYRVVDICTGDLGGAAYRKYDLEAWMPGRSDFGEVTSTSNTTDYQARRLAIRHRKDGGRPQLLHTLNGTALAISRALISLLEIYQQQDGSVMLPEVLVPYVGRERLTSS